jgi:hypothetical protein
MRSVIQARISLSVSRGRESRQCRNRRTGSLATRHGTTRARIRARWIRGTCGTATGSTPSTCCARFRGPRSTRRAGRPAPCSQVGLDSARIVGGDEIEHMTDSALAATAERTTVFARVPPAEKNRIILALKNRNHVVGFLGDGINNALRLHQVWRAAVGLPRLRGAVPDRLGSSSRWRRGPPSSSSSGPPAIACAAGRASRWR